LGNNASNDYNLLDAQLSKKKKNIEYQDEINDKFLDAQVLSNEIRLLRADMDSYELQLKQQLSNAELLKSTHNADNIRAVLYELYDYYQIQLDYADALVIYHKKRIEYDNLLDRLVNDDNCHLCENYKLTIQP
jgi:hypothetical protein